MCFSRECIVGKGGGRERGVCVCVSEKGCVCVRKVCENIQKKQQHTTRKALKTDVCWGGKEKGTGSMRGSIEAQFQSLKVHQRYYPLHITNKGGQKFRKSV